MGRNAHAFVRSSGLAALVAVSAVAGLFLGFDYWRSSPSSSATPLLAADVSPDRGSPPSIELPRAEQARIRNLFGNLPLYFVENQGQLDEQVRYYVKGRDKTLYFTSEGVTISLQGEDERWTVKLDFVDANPNVVPRGEEKQQAIFSYFKGNDPEQWRTGCPTYARVVYEDLWPGIDLVFRGTVNKLKHEFVVAPGADPSRIQIAVRGASDMRLDDDGDLVVETPVGSFEDARPVAWQELNGERVEVEVAYDFWEGAYGFTLGEFDPTLAIVLDPAMLVYCGYIGGAGSEGGVDVAVDDSGAAYVAGSTTSSEMAGFPVVFGPDVTFNGGYRDAYVAKVNPSGTSLVYCGFIGGAGDEFAGGIEVDGSGAAYVVGYTDSSESEGFPVVVGPDLTFNGDDYWDAFVAKVGPEGASLEYCGYIGGTKEDRGYGIAVDGSGAAYVTGFTFSSESDGFPVLVGPDLTYNGGVADAFVAKVHSSGEVLEYCGYVGGTEEDRSNSIAVDGSGAAYVAGETSSTELDGFPVMVGPDLTYNDYHRYDAFAAKVRPDGAFLDYCGYIGGAEIDQGKAIAVDGSGAAYVTGFTFSSESEGFPVVVGPDLTFNDGDGSSDYDAFVTKVYPSGASLEYCGYIGGTDIDYGGGIAVDGSGAAYVTGYTHSSESEGFPVLVGPDLTFNSASGTSDVFIAKVAPAGTSLEYCGYIGGLDNESGYDIALGASGEAYVTGPTQSSEAEAFPIVDGPDLTFNGFVDAFVAKIPSEFPNEFLCRWGTVNLASSPAPAPVLTVNASEGGDIDRVVVTTSGAPLTITMDAPPSGPNPAPFAMYGWIGEPTEATVTVHPKALGILCFPSPVTGGLPQPKRIWNNIGRTALLGTPSYPSDPAPSVPLSKPTGIPYVLTVTFQGIILDAGSAAQKPASLTNAVILRVVE